jgi:hypothetical protein
MVKAVAYYERAQSQTGGWLAITKRIFDRSYGILLVYNSNRAVSPRK